MKTLISCVFVMFLSSAHSSLIGVYGGTDSLDSAGTANVVSGLNSLGMFDQIDMLTGSETNLSSYDSILFYTNGGGYFNDYGNLLADYVDNGGGLVAATFLWQSSFMGRLETDGYLPFENQQGNYVYSSLGTFDAQHDIMDGITSINGSYRDIVDLSGDATLIASWADGSPLVAEDNSGVVGITLYPNDNDGQIGGDYLQLFANALSYTQRAYPVPEPSIVLLLGLGFVSLSVVRRQRLNFLKSFKF